MLQFIQIMVGHEAQAEALRAPITTLQIGCISSSQHSLNFSDDLHNPTLVLLQ